MRTSIYNLVLLAVLTTSCAGSLAGTRKGIAEPFDTRPAEIEGTLLEVRHFFETGAIADDHTYCAYLSSLAEMPVGVLTKDGRLVILTSRPSQIAAHVTKVVRVRGRQTANGQLLVPSSLRVKDGTTWATARL